MSRFLDHVFNRSREYVAWRYSLMCCLLISGIVATSIVAHSDPRDGMSSPSAIGAVVFFTLLLCPLCWPAWIWFVARLRPLRGDRVIWRATVFIVVGFALTFAVPLPVAPSPAFDVRVQALGKGASTSNGSEVWARIEVDGTGIPPNQIKHDASWTIKDGFLLAIGPSEEARWRGVSNASARIVFLSHPWSGRARVAINGIAREVDLYAPQGSDGLVIPIRERGDTVSVFAPSRTPIQRLVHMLDSLILGWLAWLLFEALGRASSRPMNSAVGRDTLTYSLPSFTASIYLALMFGPAIMTPDSIDQWNQAATRHYTDWHPAYHSMAISLLRLIWDSPTFIALIQAALLAAATGWLIASVRAATGASNKAALLASWLCALMPIITFSSITLWKDVPYTAAIVALSAVCVNMLLLARINLGKPMTFAAVLVILLSAMLFRHNGPPVAAAVIVALAWLVRPQRKLIIGLGLASLAAFVLLKGPVARLAGVERTNLSFALYVHHIAAHLANGERPSDPKDEALLRRIGGMPLGNWRYDCTVVNPTIPGRYFDFVEAGKHTGDLLRVTAEMAVHAPRTELQHLACVSGLTWRITNNAPEDPLYHYTVGINIRDGRASWIDFNQIGLREDSLFPGDAQEVAKWITTLDFDLLWRPAFYLYLCFFGVVVAGRRMADTRIIIVALPIFVHSAVLAVANVAQDVRYQLPVFVVALATLPCLLRSGPTRSTDAPTESQGATRQAE